jgi:hypothetical protein
MAGCATAHGVGKAKHSVRPTAAARDDKALFMPLFLEKSMF